MKENSIEETIKQLELILKVRKEQKEIIECAGGWCINCDPDIKALTESIDILKDYKRVLKENEIYKKNSEIMSKENLSTAEQLKVEIKENFRLKNQLENNRKEYQETYKDIREELGELKKENEELKILKSGIQTLQNLGIEDGKYIVMSKTDFLNGSCKHLLDDYISKQEIKDKIKELDERIKNPEKNSYWASYTISECIGIRRILQELLERGKNE